MDCRGAQEKMLAFINCELTDEQTEEFVEHVDSCKECNEELQISYSLYQGLRMLEDDNTDSFHIQHAFDAFMQEQRDKIRKRHIVKRFFFWLTIVAILVLILFFTLQVIRVTNPELFTHLWDF